MKVIKQSRYTSKPKGYLTYPIKGEKEVSGICSLLLTEKTHHRYFVKPQEGILDKPKVTKALSEALKAVGVEISTLDQNVTHGRDSLIVMKELKDGLRESVKLPVEIRKITKGNELIDIRIRVTGDTEGDLIKNMEAIKKALAVWDIKPKECVWSQGAWKDQESKPVINKTDVQKEETRLRKIVEDLQQKVNDLETATIKKANIDDREVREGVLR